MGDERDDFGFDNQFCIAAGVRLLYVSVCPDAHV